VLIEFARSNGDPWETCRPMSDPGEEPVRATFVLRIGTGGVRGDHRTSWFLGEVAALLPSLALVQALAALVP
jgi:hypothetical protein